MERWTNRTPSPPFGASCDTCQRLTGTAWPAGVGPQPPLHHGCTCQREPDASLAPTVHPQERDGRPIAGRELIAIATRVRALTRRFRPDRPLPAHQQIP